MAQKILNRIRQRTLDALEVVGTFVEGEAINNISGNGDSKLKAVDTGNLMNSINHKVISSEDLVRIGTAVEYAPFVEFGTSRMAARPFLRTAVLENKKRITKLFAQAMRA